MRVMPSDGSGRYSPGPGMVKLLEEMVLPGITPVDGDLFTQSLFQKPMLWSVSVVACTETDPGTSPRSADGASTESC